MYMLVLVSASGLADLSAYVLVCWHMLWTRGHAVSFRYGCPVGYVLSASASAVLSASVPFILSVSSRSVLCMSFFPFRCTWQPPFPPSLGSRFTTFPLHIRLRYNGFTFASAVFPRDC